MRALCVILLAGISIACTDSDAQGSAAANSGQDAGALAAVDAAQAAGQPSAAPDSAGSPSASTAPASAADAPGAPATLPLALGFYVTADISCADASNATLQLLRRDGVNTSRVPCDFEAIERIADNRYRVMQTCVEGGEAWGTPEEEIKYTYNWEILSNTRYKTVGEDGWETTMKHCPQSSLPDPWRDNDISDIVN